MYFWRRTDRTWSIQLDVRSKIKKMESGRIFSFWALETELWRHLQNKRGIKYQFVGEIKVSKSSRLLKQVTIEAWSERPYLNWMTIGKLLLHKWCLNHRLDKIISESSLEKRKKPMMTFDGISQIYILVFLLIPIILLLYQKDTILIITTV
jgi:hypothetical protein